MKPLLEISGLTVRNADTGVAIVRDIGFGVQPGKVLALIGESGSGKTTISLTALGYVRPGLEIAGGSIRFAGTDVLALRGDALRDFRGRSVAYVAQSAAAAFNPSLRIGFQVIEASLAHHVSAAREARGRAEELYRQMDLPAPGAIADRFPHQMSGGQLQRLMAAMAMCTGPELIVFDEPTTALDVTTQIEVLKSFKDLIRLRNTAALYVSHDLAVVAQIADDIIVLRDGEIQERGSVQAIIADPQHEYTRLLIAASDPQRRSGGVQVPSFAASEPGPPLRQPVLEVRKLWAGYGARDASGQPAIPVIRGVDLAVQPKSVLAIIGESGSGKSTTARVICGLLPASRGEVLLDGTVLPASVAKRSKTQLSQIQLVMQMADVALNPSHTIGKILGRPLEYFLDVRGGAKEDRVADLLRKVQLPTEFVRRLPNELSGGQKQRVNLARALAVHPKVVLCDEVTSALDTVVRDAIIDLILELKDTLDLSFVLISHDISTVSKLADHVAVMYLGEVVEMGKTGEVLEGPKHDYTRRLLASVPHLRVGWLEDAIAAQAQSEMRATRPSA
jgi:peptide/nickel transport system ATP-binding protein